MSVLKLLSLLPAGNGNILSQLLDARRIILWCESLFNCFSRSYHNLHFFLIVTLGDDHETTKKVHNVGKERVNSKKLFPRILRMVFEDLIRNCIPSALEKNPKNKFKIGSWSTHCTGE
jgi:hypothetical protein